MKLLLRIALVLYVAVAFVACSSEKPENIVPLLTTLPATDITHTEATLNGQVQLYKGATVPKFIFTVSGLNQGVGYLYDATVVDGDKVSMRLTSLTPGQTYTFALGGNNGSYVVNGNRLEFTTLPNSKPLVGDYTILSRGPGSVYLGYSLLDNGGETDVQTGCYYEIEGNTEPGERRLSYGSPTADGKYTVQLSYLDRNTTYIIYPYANSPAGEYIGEGFRFTTTDAIEQKEPGLLSTLLGNNAFDMTSLVLAGPLNGSDLATLRRMVISGCLVDIDMTDTRIVEGGNVYADHRYTENDVVGQGLFSGCTNLKKVLLPSGTTRIERDAFADCKSLETIFIPANAAEVTASGGCTQLKAIEVSGANTAYKSVDGVLFDIKGEQLCWFPIAKTGEFTLPPTVKAIGDYAFQGCSITRFIFSDGLTTLGKGVFNTSKVEEVVLPRTLKTIPSATFQNCQSLKKVTLGTDTELLSDYVFFGCPLTDLYVGSVYPPSCSSNAFYTNVADFPKKCVLHVPAGRKTAYRSSANWNIFTTIKEDY